MINTAFKIFVDFDGTITKQDVGDAIFRRFGDVDKVNLIIDDLLQDKISAKESWTSLCKSVEKINEEELTEFLENIQIDETFLKFEKYCSENDFRLFVLSDGFNFYIDRIFNKHNLSHVNYYSNKLKIINNKLVPSFPYLDASCTSSANCKRNHIIEHSGEDDFTVFIGDGNSDKYTIQFCDFIFAKDDLLRYCEIERISYFPFKNFEDVIDRMETLKAKKRLKKRHQAELKRKEIYMQE
jgi:2-hydroxy-3-keto-5-methylthiopentenyl-1-phosphate phosphatase